MAWGFNVLRFGVDPQEGKKKPQKNSAKTVRTSGMS
jgi:hypothetical protein